MLDDVSPTGQDNFLNKWINENGAAPRDDETPEQNHARNLEAARVVLKKILKEQRNNDKLVHKFKSNDKLARSHIADSLEGDLAQRFLTDLKGNVISTKQMWLNINNFYISKNIVQLSNLQRSWNELEINDGELIKDFAQRVKNLVNQLYSVDIDKSQLEICHQFLDGCFHRDSLVTSVLTLRSQLSENSNIDDVSLKLSTMIMMVLSNQ